jgi:hypothetical protein
MHVAVDAHIIIEIAREYYGIRVAAERASEIAAEVNVLNEIVRAAAKGLPFDCHPDEFVTTLVALGARSCAPE